MTNASRRVVSALAVVAAMGVAAAPAAAQTEVKPVPLSTAHEGGYLVFRTADSSFMYWIDARLQVDAAMYTGGKNALSNGTEVRRARLGGKVTLYTNWHGELDVDFAENAVEMKDVWLGYMGFQNSLLKVGNFKEPFSLETLTSSKYITFMERSYIDNLSPDRHIGAAYVHWGRNWQATVGLFGQVAGTPDATGRDEATAITGRFTVAPINKPGELLHLGIAASRRTTDAASGADTNTVRFRARPETDVSKARFLTTGKIRSTDYTLFGNAELAMMKDAASLQAEFTQVDVHRLAGLKTASFNGYYVFGSWFLTGETKTYLAEEGEFDRVIPKSAGGAWELAVRMSNLNLNDNSSGVGIQGGQATNYTVGLNWHINPNFKWMFDVTFVRNDDNAKPDIVPFVPAIVGDKFTIVATRFSVAF